MNGFNEVKGKLGVFICPIRLFTVHSEGRKVLLEWQHMTELFGIGPA